VHAGLSYVREKV